MLAGRGRGRSATGAAWLVCRLAGRGWDRVVPAGGRARDQLEQAAHHDRVPQLAAGPPVLLDPPPLLGEAALAVQRDRGGVVREHLEAELVQTLARAPGRPPPAPAPTPPRGRASRGRRTSRTRRNRGGSPRRGSSRRSGLWPPRRSPRPRRARTRRRAPRRRPAARSRSRRVPEPPRRRPPPSPAHRRPAPAAPRTPPSAYARTPRPGRPAGRWATREAQGLSDQSFPRFLAARMIWVTR